VLSASVAGTIQHGAKPPVLSQRSVNVLHVNKPQPPADPKSTEPKPNSKHNSGICANNS